MEICVSALVNNIEPCECSASQAELGENAGRITWASSVEAGKLWGVLDTPAKLEAMREHLRGYGAWTADKIAALTPAECNAFLAQEVAQWMRELKLPPGPSDKDWEAAQRYAEKELDGGNQLYRGDDGEFYVYLER